MPQSTPAASPSLFAFLSSRACRPGQPLRRLLSWCSVSASLALSGCGTLNTQTLPFRSSLNSTAATEKRADPPLRQPAVAQANDQTAVVPVGYEEPVSYEEPAGAFVDCGDGALDCQPCATPCDPVPAPAMRNAQEYIFDGGDQQPTVVIRKDWSQVGVDPTDTVVYYETLGGQVCVQPTNRVPIYAPRFGAVRQVTGAFLAARAVGAERILVPVSPGRFDDTDLAGTVKQPLAPHGEQQINLIDAFQENAVGTPIAQIVPPLRMSEALVPLEGSDSIGLGGITDDEIAVLGRVLQNARTWFVPESLGVMISGQQATMVVDSKRAQDIFVYEMPDKCAMRICKTASHTIANPGDVVSFTIRFDNAGVKPLGNAVIVDSLSPRLDYIEGSQQSSVDVRFSAEPNEVGSQVLTWEIVDPIGKNEGGAISFDCRVR